MFQTLLIANRGEIAARVIRTARRLGLATVAVYSDADAQALHVAMADRAIRIGPAPARESYLDIGAVIAAAKEAGAEAIHPGYGFLSENAEFAEACAAAGIVFVGPPPSAIRAMGLKDRAKALMQDAGVPVVPGYLGDDQSAATLAREAAHIGYPVLIKAVAGGGGKGMRRVDEPDAFAAQLEGAKREAASAFGNDAVLIEKYVARPRHIEVQVFADSQGNAVHLFERDCSLQRRHQKVIEEAPAPGLPPAMREAIGATAVKAAKAVGYVGAGTIEFIADASDGLRADRIWFMEMNTRLQVEHPVTEAITGLDLVEWQLRIAAGEPLPVSQHDLHIRGHAIEVRLYAEDPQSGFLPSIGTLERLHLPDDVRVDSGVREGDTVTPYYDPMIAKIIAHVDTRERTVAKLAAALQTVEIAGVRTNSAFLIRALTHPAFVAGDIDTGFIDRHLDALLPPAAPPPWAFEAAAHRIAFGSPAANATDPWDRRDGFCLGGRRAPQIVFAFDGKPHVAAAPFEAPAANVLHLSSGAFAAMAKGETYTVSLYDPFEAAESEGAATDRVVTPMPGKIVQLLVKEGDRVKGGQPLAVLEAMKMEHTLSAPGAAEVEAVGVGVGDQVGEGTIVVRFRAEKGAA